VVDAFSRPHRRRRRDRPAGPYADAHSRRCSGWRNIPGIVPSI
jgi:hypothetical protein